MENEGWKGSGREAYFNEKLVLKSISCAPSKFCCNYQLKPLYSSSTPTARRIAPNIAAASTDTAPGESFATMPSEAGHRCELFCYLGFCPGGGFYQRPELPRLILTHSIYQVRPAAHLFHRHAYPMGLWDTSPP